jgi:LysM repeat protein
MARRNPARFLAPIALVAFVFVLYSVVQDGREPAGGNTGAPVATATATATSKAAKKNKSTKKAKTYTVKAGDTPSGIAEKTGVSLETLQQLNPELDPATLAPGQRVKLSE